MCDQLAVNAAAVHSADLHAVEDEAIAKYITNRLAEHCLDSLRGPCRVLSVLPPAVSRHTRYVCSAGGTLNLATFACSQKAHSGAMLVLGYRVYCMHILEHGLTSVL